MSQPLVVSMAPNIIVSGGYTLRVTAVNAATGAVVAGVNISDVSFEVEDLRGSGESGLYPVILLRSGASQVGGAVGSGG